LVNIDKIKKIAKSKGIKLSYIAQQLGYYRGYLYEVEKRGAVPTKEVIQKIADLLDTSVEYLTDQSDDVRPLSEVAFYQQLSSDNMVVLPVYEGVSAGMGAVPNEVVQEYMPCYVENPAEAKEMYCLRVSGDSMFPKIEDGDVVQVHQQSVVDDGQIAVVFVDGEGFVKILRHKKEKIELASVNPMYKPMVYDPADVQVLGRVIMIFKRC